MAVRASICRADLGAFERAGVSTRINWLYGFQSAEQIWVPPNAASHLARLDSQDIEDIFVLNLQRAVQTAIDLGAHVLASEQLEMPVTLREIFVVLHHHHWISADVSQQMQKMCGFRNIAVHDYQALSKPILKIILVDHLHDIEHFYTAIIDRLPPMTN